MSGKFVAKAGGFVVAAALGAIIGALVVAAIKRWANREDVVTIKPGP